MALTFRPAAEADTGLILQFIRALAEYEKMLDLVVADEALLEEQLFQKKNAEVIFAMEEGKEVGFALFFHNFSTFLGRSGLYLEDLYVLPEFRGKGYGKALLKKLALPTQTQYDAQTLFEAASRDKKIRGATMDLVVPRDIGNCELYKIAVEELSAWIQEGL